VRFLTCRRQSRHGTPLVGVYNCIYLYIAVTNGVLLSFFSPTFSLTLNYGLFSIVYETRVIPLTAKLSANGCKCKLKHISHDCWIPNESVLVRVAFPFSKTG